MKKITTLVLALCVAGVLVLTGGCATKKAGLQIAHDSVSTVSGAAHAGISMVQAAYEDVKSVYCYVRGMISAPCPVEEAAIKEAAAEASDSPLATYRQASDGDDPILAQCGLFSDGRCWITTDPT